LVFAYVIGLSDFQLGITGLVMRPVMIDCAHGFIQRVIRANHPFFLEGEVFG
jgi:hypothetical protein